MQDENDNLNLDNERLAKSNIQYEGLISNHQTALTASSTEASHFGDKIALSESQTYECLKKETKFAKSEKILDGQMHDLVEYTKWITLETEKLRDRVRASEKIINDLRTSGEQSVESLMESLYLLKMKAEDMEIQAEQLRDLIQNKEAMIK